MNHFTCCYYCNVFSFTYSFPFTKRYFFKLSTFTKLICLNNKPYFNKGVLDQGYTPWASKDPRRITPKQETLDLCKGVLDGKIPLIGAAGDHRGLADGDDTHIAGSVVGILHGDRPVGAVRFEPKRLDISAQGDDSACNAGVIHGADGVIGCTALGHRSKGDFRIYGEGDSVGAGAGEGGQHHLVEAFPGQVSREGKTWKK